MKENEKQDTQEKQKDSTFYFGAKPKVRGEKKTKQQRIRGGIVT